MSSLKNSLVLRESASKIIHRRMLYTAGLGLIPIPIVDVVSILGIQVLMIKDIAKLYNIPFKEQQVKSFIGALVGYLGTAGVVKAVPGLGTAFGGITMSLTGIASTYAIGKVFTQHFDQGGTLLDFDPVKSRQYFQESFEEGELKAKELKATNQNAAGQPVHADTQDDMAPTQISSTDSDKVANKPSDNKIDNKTGNKMSPRSLSKEQGLKIAAIKKRKKARRNRRLKMLAFLLVLSGIGVWFYNKSQSEAASGFSDIDLYMQETKGKKVNLQAVEVLDSAATAAIAKFSPISTEGVIAKYIQSPNATFPKRYALSAVRFTGSSDAISSSAREQLSHIALLMKKYPDLTISLYGHASNKGPQFNRQRVGRERARALTSIFENEGIPSFRLTGSYIEKPESAYQEYWGAEMVLDVSTVESVVEIQAPAQLRKTNNSGQAAKEEKTRDKGISGGDSMPVLPAAQSAQRTEQTSTFAQKDSSLSDKKPDTVQSTGLTGGQKKVDTLRPSAKSTKAKTKPGSE